MELTEEQLALLASHKGLKHILKGEQKTLKAVVKHLQYEAELEQLQVELVKMQRWVQEYRKKVMILFEGRDAAGKGGAILRFTRHLSPRGIRIVALPAPSNIEKGQWYFQRYVQNLPDPGQIVFFDRSWYNRAVVEPVNGFCDQEQYERFMIQVPAFENMLLDAGVILIKFWFSISKETQAERFEERQNNPLKQWKVSLVDQKAQELWDEYTHYKDEMFKRTSLLRSPWIIVKADNKKKARLECIRYVLSQIDYEGKENSSVQLTPNSDIIIHY